MTRERRRANNRRRKIGQREGKRRESAKGEKAERQNEFDDSQLMTERFAFWH
jgi:hypothetical protein